VANKKTVKIDEDRKELVEIYNSLTPSVKSSLMTTARVILNTQNIILADTGKTKRKKIIN